MIFSIINEFFLTTTKAKNYKKSVKFSAKTAQTVHLA